MNYKEVLCSDFFFDTYSKIEFMKNDYPVNHGFVHIWNVINYAKTLANIFMLSNEETNLLLISCALHDIGYKKGRDNHAENGSLLAKEFLKDKLFNHQIDIICDAIKNHGGEKLEDYYNNISMCMVLADKFDFDKTRYRKDNINNWTDQFLNIEKIFLDKKDNIYTLTIKITKDFDILEFKNCKYYKKLNIILNNLYQSRNIKINIKFEVI